MESAAQLIALLEQVNGEQPAVVTFISRATGESDFRNPAIKLSNRYASLLSVLDPTGTLEQRFRGDIIAAATLLHSLNNADFTDQDDIKATFNDPPTYVASQASSAGNLF